MRNTKEKSWYEQDDFWANFEPALFTQKRINDAGEEVEQVLALLDLQAGAKICDLCCGIGRHSLELARRRFDVTAVDRTPTYLAKARAGAKDEGLDVEFVAEDARSFKRPEAFDVVLNLFTSFGFFEDARDNKKVLENIYSSLKSGGKLVMELAGKEVLARISRERYWVQLDDTIILCEEKFSDDWSRGDNRWILIKDGRQQAEYRFSLRLYSAAELKELLKGCGFQQVDIYGSIAGEPYDQNAKRLVVVARK
jgi:SAM-dependent methyltransferase